jgi:threonine dehydratase
LLLKNQRLIVEGGGAVAMAAALSFPRILGRNTAVLLTGSSVDIHSLYTIYNRYYPV